MLNKYFFSECPMFKRSLFRRSDVQKVFVPKVLCSVAPMFRMSCIKKRETAQKTPQEEAQDVEQETSQEARKTRHEEQKQTAVHSSRLRKHW